ncbi:hypothetical protein BJ508DRAFT_129716 [Ascobolus immersus RN42]|uniref:Uncharacterized protein n=1 Tax=Ascobolus immersus RN42 TaxID=1160509 RepID=A0A3N4I2X4_ASCIM|nr:hypothetical protein BJ508DRAFT_129716 [Ascobolus immersus RN42]
MANQSNRTNFRHLMASHAAMQAYSVWSTDNRRGRGIRNAFRKNVFVSTYNFVTSTSFSVQRRHCQKSKERIPQTVVVLVSNFYNTTMHGYGSTLRIDGWLQPTDYYHDIQLGKRYNSMELLWRCPCLYECGQAKHCSSKEVEAILLMIYLVGFFSKGRFNDRLWFTQR